RARNRLRTLPVYHRTGGPGADLPEAKFVLLAGYEPLSVRAERDPARRGRIIRGRQLPDPLLRGQVPDPGAFLAFPVAYRGPASSGTQRDVPLMRRALEDNLLAWIFGIQDNGSFIVVVEIGDRASVLAQGGPIVYGLRGCSQTHRRAEADI